MHRKANGRLPMLPDRNVHRIVLLYSAKLCNLKEVDPVGLEEAIFFLTPTVGKQFTLRSISFCPRPGYNEKGGDLRGPGALLRH